MILLGFYIANAQSKVVTIAWDTSLSSADRDIQRELTFLDSIFSVEKYDKAQLILFSNAIEEKDFEVTHGNWIELREVLENTPFDGATIFQNLNTVVRKGKTFVFTDGVSVLTDDFLSLDKGDVIINSSSEADRKTLMLWAFLGRAEFFDLSNVALKTTKSMSQKVIKGTVYYDSRPISNVQINTSLGNIIVSDKNGNFTYEGKAGDTLSIKGVGANNAEIVVGNEDDELRFFLDSKTVALDEVTVTDRFLEKETTVMTAYGTVNKNSLGYAVSTVSDADINDSEAKLHEALDGKVSGMQITKASGWDNRSTLGKTVIRGYNSINMSNYALVVIDGVPVEQSVKFFGGSGAKPALGDINTFSPTSGSGDQRDALFDYVDPANIAEVTVLKGLAATNRFGSIGSNGVIMITTKTSLGSNGSKTIVDRARLTDNIFEGKLIAKKGQLNTPYLKELRKAKNLKSAYGVYLKQRNYHKDDYSYFIDVSNYFRTANAQLADRVLSNILETHTTYKKLRSLYLQYSKQNNAAMALLTAEKMVEEYPKKIQSHYDHATALLINGKYQAAALTLGGIVSGNIDKNTDFSPLNKIAGATLRNLVNQHKRELDLNKIDERFVNNLTYDVRLVFDWQGPENVFTLKFVNPQKRYFDWKHSSIGDKKRIADEIRNGFSSEQFEIIGESSMGEWGIYITNITNEDYDEPFWVKCTAEYGFGKPNQYSETYLIRLDPSDQKEQLFFEFTSGRIN